MNVTLEDAYREACTALGESVVRERLLQAALVDAETRETPPEPTPTPTPS